MIYQQLYDAVLAEIRVRCVNVTNYTSLPDCFRPSFTKTVSNSYNNYKTRSTTQYSVINPVPQITQAQVDAAFKDSMTKSGIYGIMSQEVSTQGLLNFFKAVSVFCRDYIHVCSSTMHNNRYVVFVNQVQGSYPTNLEESDIIKAKSGIDVAQTLTRILTTITPYIVRYNTTISVKPTSTINPGSPVQISGME